MRRLLADYGLFLKEFRRTFHTTGALLPSSPLLARALARHVGAGDNRSAADVANAADVTDEAAGKRILEVGPGTGAVTRSIVKRMGPRDTLDLVEFNERFVERLRQAFASDPLLQSVAERTTIVHQMIQDVEHTHQYDVIVSGLPLNNFAVADVESILEKFRLLAKPTGTLSFFEYIAVRPLRGAVSGRDERQRLRGVGRALGELFRQHPTRRQSIWINVPPAWVHHVRFS